MVAPTLEYITNLRDHLTTVWMDTHRRWAEIDTYLQGTFELWPAGVERPKYHPGTAFALIDQAVNHQMPTKLTVKRFPAGDTYKRKRTADKVEVFLEALMAEVARKEPVHTVGQVKRHLLAYGYSILEGPILDSREYQKMLDGPESKGWNPLRLRAPHPQRVLMSPSERNPGEGIKRVRRSSEEVKALLVRKKASKEAKVYKDWEPTREGYQELDTTEYWSEDWHLFMVEDMILYAEENVWGYFPFIQGFSGWGMEPTDLAQINPKYLAVSLLEHVMESLKVEAQRKTAQHNSVIEAGFQRKGYDKAQGGNLTDVQAAEALARDGLLSGKKEAWWYQDTPRLPDWMFQVGQEIDQDIENATFSKTVGGHRLPGVNTVGQQAILSTAAERKFDAPSFQIDEMFSVAGSNFLRLIDQLDVDITVRGVTVGPKDIKGDYSVDIAFQDENPMILAQLKADGLRELEAGVLDPETYLEDTGRDNGQEILRRAMVYKVITSEQVLSTAIEVVASEHKRRHRIPTDSLLGPNGLPIQSQPRPPVQQPAPGPGLEAMRNVPGGPGEQQVFNGQVADGLTNGLAPGGV